MKLYNKEEVAKIVTLEDLLVYFESIPEEQIITRLLYDRKGNYCARGWLRGPKFASFQICKLENDVLDKCINKELFKVFLKKYDINGYHLGVTDLLAHVNNGRDYILKIYPNDTPKQRVIAFINDLIKIRESICSKKE